MMKHIVARAHGHLSLCMRKNMQKGQLGTAAMLGCTFESLMNCQFYFVSKKKKSKTWCFQKLCMPLDQILCNFWLQEMRVRPLYLGFSTSVPLTFGARSFLVVLHCTMSGSTPSSYPLHASSTDPVKDTSRHCQIPSRRQN